MSNGRIVDLKNSSGEIVKIEQGESNDISGSLVDASGAAITLANIQTLKLTLYNECDDTVINSREEQDILNSNQCVVDSSGNYTLRLGPLDNPIVDSDLLTNDEESHIARFVWSWNDGVAVRTNKQEGRFWVRKIASVSATTQPETETLAVSTYGELRLLSTTASYVIVTSEDYGGAFVKITGKTENGGTVIASAVESYQWQRVAALEDPDHLHADWWELGGYDANGNAYTGTDANGIHDEADKFTSAIIAGGDYCTVHGTPGKTHTISKRINGGTGTTIDLNGATLKRADEISTTLTTAYSSGTSLAVSDASSFRVGDAVTLLYVAGASAGQANDDAGDTQTITAISDNTITLSNEIAMSTNNGADYPIGSKLIRSFGMIGFGSAEPVGDGNCSIINGAFDGNRDNNTSTYSWRHNSVITFDGSRVDSWLVDDARFVNLPCEAVFGGSNGTMKNCIAEDINGSLLHASDVAGNDGRVGGIFVQNIIAKNTGEQATLNGHAAGLFEWSANVKDYQVQNVYAQAGASTQHSAFGSLDADDEGFKLSNLKMIGYQGILQVNTALATAESVDFQLRNFYFEDCGDLVIEGEDVRKGQCPADIVIESGTFRGNSRIAFQDAARIRLQGLHLSYDEGYDFGGLLRNDYAAVSFYNCIDVTLNNITIVGPETFNTDIYQGLNLRVAAGSHQVKSDASTTEPYFFMQHVTLHDIKIRRFPEGIRTTNTHVPTFEVQCVDWNWSKLRIEMADSASLTTVAIGVQVPPGCVCRDTEITVYNTGTNFNEYPFQCCGIHEDASGSDNILRGGFMDGVLVLGDPTSTRSGMIGTASTGQGLCNAWVDNVEKVVTANVVDITGGLSYLGTVTTFNSSLWANYTSPQKDVTTEYLKNTDYY